MNVAFKYICLTIITFFTLTSAGQDKKKCDLTLQGKVTSLSGDAIPFAQILLFQQSKGSVTDETGNFKLDHLCAGQVIIQCRLFNNILTTDTLFLDQSIIKNYQVSTEGIALEAVEISVPKLLESISPVQKLEIYEIEKSSQSTLGGILEKVNGVRSLKTGNSVSKPIIHGMHSNRILVLNNGIRQEGQQWGTEHAPEIDPTSAQSISIIKGANAIKYGFDAVGGIILIEPLKASENPGMTGSLKSSLSSNGQSGMISGFLSGRPLKLKPFSWTAQGSMKRSGDMRSPDYFLNNTGVEEYNFSGSLNWDQERFNMQFFYSQFNTELGIFSGSHIGNLTDLQQAFELNSPPNASNFSYKINDPKQEITHEFTQLKSALLLSENHSIHFQFGRQFNQRLEYDKDPPRNDSLAQLNIPDLLLELTSHTLDVFWKHQRLFGKKTSGEVGIQSLNQTNTFSGRLFVPNFRNQGIGAYWVERKEFEKWKIEGGMRLDWRFLEVFQRSEESIESSEHTYTNTTFHLGFVHLVDQNNSFGLNFSKNWRPPSINELYSDGLHHGAAAIEYGVVSLSEENSFNTSFDYNYDTEKWNIEIHSYLHYFQNYIFLNPQLPPTLTIMGAFPTFKFEETKATIAGLDFLTRWKCLSNLTTEVKLSILRGRDQSNKEHLINMPADYFQNSWTYKIKNFRRWDNNNLTFKWSYVSRQNCTPLNSDFVPPPEAYGLVDIEYATVFNCNKRRIHFFIGINNVLNKSYRDYLNRFRYFADDMGRNATLKVRIPLNKTI